MSSFDPTISNALDKYVPAKARVLDGGLRFASRLLVGSILGSIACVAAAPAMAQTASAEIPSSEPEPHSDQLQEIIVVVADWTHSTSLWNDTERTLLLRRPATDIFNSSVTYRSPDGRYDLSVGGTNLTDERYLITGSFSQGTVFGTYSRPAEWFGRLSFHL